MRNNNNPHGLYGNLESIIPRGYEIVRRNKGIITIKPTKPEEGK